MFGFALLYFGGTGSAPPPRRFPTAIVATVVARPLAVDPAYTLVTDR